MEDEMSGERTVSLKEPWQMTKEEYTKNDPLFQRAVDNLNQAQLRLNTFRWGEARRFAGRMAGNRLAVLDKARKRWSRAYERAEEKHLMIVLKALSKGHPVPEEVLRDYKELPNCE
jgi:hypothetical protein